MAVTRTYKILRIVNIIIMKYIRQRAIDRVRKAGIIISNKFIKSTYE